jgi:antirestriction protein ArdC
MNRQQIYEAVTQKIIAQLEQGTVPWQKEWAGNVTGPFNFKTGKAYRGINYWNLSSYDYQSPAWLTFHQVRQLGLKVKKGAKSASVLFWKLIEIADKETGEIKKVPYPRIYHVFNTEQVEGLEYNPNDCPYDLHLPSESIVRTYSGAPSIKTSTNGQCYYHPLQDEVRMVPMGNFHRPEGYYATLFHELVHSTGHSKRLDRKLDTELHAFGDPVYSHEELVAEMGAAQLCAIAGISQQTIDNSAAYIKGWLSVLKDDRQLLIQASQKAQLAADYILGKSTDY